MNVSSVFSVPRVKLTGDPLRFSKCDYPAQPKQEKPLNPGTFSFFADFSEVDRYTPGIEEILHDNMPEVELVRHCCQVSHLYY